MPKTVLEAAWLYHELGRCCLELGRFSDAASYGEQSLESATQANDDNWQINSSVLIAQAEGTHLQTFCRTVVTCNSCSSKICRCSCSCKRCIG